ncbi:MAG TPA: glycoside hydrolase family 13 protein [Cellvibrio sp.]|nr:glycoside hydrolase family 13 protein [Cellvibrio sp.]
MKKILILLSTFALPFNVSAAPYEIQHLEPLSWWVGMKHPELQLMVHGENIAELTPQIDYAGVKLVNIERTDNKNYLFINLLVAADAKPGSMEILFNRDGKRVTKASYKLEARRSGSAQRPSFSAKDVVYLITPDRFANGNPDNDSQPGMLDKVDRSNPVSRHGGDIKGIQQQLDYIADMGFTMIWPTPLLENNQPEYSYHGYALTDYYRIDSRFGSNQEYKNFVAAANKKGMGVIQDIVLNHIGSSHWWMRDLPAADWLNYQDKAVMTNNQHTTIQDIHVAPEDKKRFADGWFVESMPDLNQRNPLVARYLLQNSIWWIEYANLSGVREDTYAYTDAAFLSTWTHYLTAEYPNLNIVGEEMNGNPHIVSYWQKGVKNRDGYESGLPALMDFPVVDILSPVFTSDETSGQGLIKLYEMIASDFVYADPMNLMVFPDNHDLSRIYSRLNENLDLLKSVMLFTATTRGIPQYYYGTEILAKSPIIRDDGLRRSDMPGGWKGDKVNAFTGKGLTARQADAQQYLKTLLNWRKGNSAITSGKLQHYIPQDGVYVYFRYDDAKSVMVVINKNATDTELDLTRFQDRIKSKTQGRDIIAGQTVDLNAPLKLKAMTSRVIDL